MRLSPTLSLYIGRQFLVSVGFVLLVLLSLALMIDLIELLRRAANRPEASFGIILQMAILRLPNLMQKLLPFVTLFATMVAYTRMTRTNELTVTRASGVSAWQFLIPPVLIAFLGGIAFIAVINPIASAMEAKAESMDARYLRGKPSLLKISGQGLWLRQADEQGQSVIHALSASNMGIDLGEVTIFLYEGQDHFRGRIDAKRARLEKGFWHLENALITGPDKPAERHDVYRLPTPLTVSQIQESFASPSTLSIWELPGFISTLRKAGFSAVKHRLHWHSLLSHPLLLVAMVLIGASFSFRPARRGGTIIMLSGGVLMGFILFLFTDIVFAFGQSGSIPVLTAAWIPAAVSTLFGMSLLLHLEDG